MLNHLFEYECVIKLFQMNLLCNKLYIFQYVQIYSPATNWLLTDSSNTFVNIPTAYWCNSILHSNMKIHSITMKHLAIHALSYSTRGISMIYDCITWPHNVSYPYFNRLIIIRMLLSHTNINVYVWRGKVNTASWILSVCVS